MPITLNQIRGYKAELEIQLEKFSNAEWATDGTPLDMRKLLHTLTKIATTSKKLRLSISKHAYESYGDYHS